MTGIGEGRAHESVVMLSAADVIRLLGLTPHPEGGHFRETFRDALERIARYKRLTCPEEIRIIEGNSETVTLGLVRMTWAIE